MQVRGQELEVMNLLQSWFKSIVKTIWDILGAS
jgi:hypothetical protein